MPIIICVTVLLIILVIAIIINNQIIFKKNLVTQAFGSIEIYLKKRFDLIPNLIAMLNKYLSHEKEMLLRLTALRSNVEKANNPEEKITAANELTKMMSGLKVSVENYPNLKADEQFLNLQYELTDIEDQISAARRAYNAGVTAYNNKIQMFPASLVAGFRNDKAAMLLEIPKEEKKEVNINQLLNS